MHKTHKAGELGDLAQLDQAGATATSQGMVVSDLWSQQQIMQQVQNDIHKNQSLSRINRFRSTSQTQKYKTYNKVVKSVNEFKVMQSKVNGDGRFDINKFKIGERGHQIHNNVQGQIFSELDHNIMMGAAAFRNDNIRASHKLTETADFHSVTGTDSHMQSAAKLSPLRYASGGATSAFPMDWQQNLISIDFQFSNIFIFQIIKGDKKLRSNDD